MARPRMETDEKRTEVVQLRMTYAEREHVRAQAQLAGIGVSEFVRRRALGYVVPSGGGVRRPDPALITELNGLGVQLSALGNNANQLARSTHTGRSFRVRWQAVADAVMEAKAEVTAVLERVVLAQSDPEADR